MSDSGQPAPGWYPTGNGGEVRYWDGAAWTEHVHQQASALAPPTGKARVSFVKVWLIASAVFFVFSLASLANSIDEVDFANDSGYATGYVLGAFLSPLLLGALVAWPIWWFMNRNRS